MSDIVRSLTMVKARGGRTGDASAVGIASVYGTHAIRHAMSGVRYDDFVGLFCAWSLDAGLPGQRGRVLVGGFECCR